jgi:hypothetical protein
MTFNRFALTAAFVAAATAASTVSAQDRDARKREAARSAQSGSTKGEAHGQAREQRAEPARPAEAPRRAEAERRAEPRRDDRSGRPEYRQEYRPEYRGNSVVGRAAPRSRDAEIIRNEKFRDAERRDYLRDNYERHYYYNRGRSYVPRVYYRPYEFRPHLSIGFGIFAGYPVPYAYRYAAPIYVYGYRAPRVPVYVTPGSPLYGGVALEIGPYDADVFVDGNFAGHVEDFDGSVQPLTLVAGTHRIEVQAPGYAPLIFDVTVQPGQVIPYRGDLRPF